MKPHLLIALAAALVVPMGTPVTAAPVTAQASDAERLAVLLAPDEAMIGLLDTSMRGQARQIPELAKDPRLTDFVLARLKPEVEAVMRGALPELRTEIAKIIARELNAGEIGDVLTFCGSPTGRKLQAVSFEVAGENPGASPEELQRLTVERFSSRIEMGDYAPLTAFGSSSGAQKLPRVSQMISEASEAWSNRLLTAHGARMLELRNQAIADYRRDHPETAK